MDLKKYIAYVPRLPTHIESLMFGLWVWTKIIYYLSRTLNAILSKILKHAPDQYTYDFNHLLFLKSNVPNIKMIAAQDNYGNIITNRLKLYMNYYWDNEIGDNGGVDMDKFSELLKIEQIALIYTIKQYKNIEKNKLVELFRSMYIDFKKQQVEIECNHAMWDHWDYNEDDPLGTDNPNDQHLNKCLICSVDDLMFGQVMFK